MTDKADALRLADVLFNVTEDDAYAQPWTFGQNCKAGAQLIGALLTRAEAAEARAKSAAILCRERDARITGLSTQLKEVEVEADYWKHRATVAEAKLAATLEREAESQRRHDVRLDTSQERFEKAEAERDYLREVLDPESWERGW